MGNGARNGNGHGNKFLAPRVIQATGLVLLCGSVAIWAFTERQSALLVSASLTLIGLGSYQNAVNSMRNVIENVNQQREDRGGEVGVGGQANGSA
jgi:hypothetical protein